MQFSLFISKRIRHNKIGTFSATVYKIGVAGVAIGVLVSIIAFGVLYGYKEAMQEKVFLFGSHLRLTQLTTGDNFYDEAPIEDNESIIATLNETPEVKSWQGVAHKSGVLKTESELKGVILKGVDPKFHWDNFNQALIEGRPIQFPDPADSTYSTEVIISKKMAKELYLKLGDKVLMYFVQTPPRVRNLTVVGIYETGLLEEFDDRFLIGDIDLIRRLNNWEENTYGSYEIFLNDFNTLNTTHTKLFEALPMDTFLVKITDLHRLLFDWLLLMDTNTTVLITLILIVACFNMISVLLIMIMERTPFVGLLKTLGTSNSQIRNIFTNIGLFIIAKGLLYGNLIGIGFCWLQQRFKFIPLDPVNYFVDTVPIVLHWPTIIVINIACSVIVGLIVLLPTIIISKIQPVKSLIFKK